MILHKSGSDQQEDSSSEHPMTGKLLFFVKIEVVEEIMRTLHFVVGCKRNISFLVGYA